MFRRLSKLWWASTPLIQSYHTEKLTRATALGRIKHLRDPRSCRGEKNFSSGRILVQKENLANSSPMESNDDAVTLSAKEPAHERLKNLTDSEAKKLKVIKLEYEVALASGEFVPENMTDDLWWKAYQCSSRASRRKLYRHLGKLEKIANKEKKRKKENRVKMMKHFEEKVAAGTRIEGKYEYIQQTKNTLFLKILDKTMNQHYSRRMYESLLFGNKIVFDMSYDDYMRPQDITNLVDQILEAHGVNKLYPDPFYIYFCNAKPDSKFVKRLDKSTAGEYVNYPFTVTDQNYLELFPKKDLVFLTPNAPNYLEKYDPNSVYIIGGLVDKVVTKPVTMAKAKREGIRMAKLPIDMYMRFMVGSKSFTLNQIMGIMCEVHNNKGWREAFKYVPRRKAVFMDETEEYRSRMQKMASRASRKYTY